MEIITGVERRRQWRDEEKLRILAELDEPGVKFSAVARSHDISRSLLWQWRDARRRGRLVAETPAFVPLHVVPSQRRSARLPCGACWRRYADDPDALRRPGLAGGGPDGYAAWHEQLGAA